MVVNILLFLLCVSETLQHLSYPLNFCNMASTCIHDRRGVCASSPDGCSRKSFLDQCDMYEYNCDFGTQFMMKVTSSCTSGYQETYILFCGTFSTPTQFTEIQSSMTKDPTSNGLSKSSLKHLTQILSENVTSKSQVYETDTLPSTVSINVSTSTPVKNISKETGSNKNDGPTIVNQTSPVYCCDRPLTWETTSEVTNIYDYITIENNSDENKQTEYNITDNLHDLSTIHENENNITEVTNIYEDVTIKNNSDESYETETSTEYNITDNLYDLTTIHENENNITFTTMNPQISDTVATNDTTLFENTETDEAPGTKLSTMEIVDQTSPTYCCDRPATWESTTEVTQIFEDITIENNSSDENEIDKKDENNDEPIKKIDIVTYTTNSYNKDTSKYSTTPATLPYNKLRLFTKRLHLKCNNKCQRPLTWLTTTRRRKRF